MAKDKGVKTRVMVLIQLDGTLSVDIKGAPIAGETLERLIVLLNRERRKHAVEYAKMHISEAREKKEENNDDGAE